TVNTTVYAFDANQVEAAVIWPLPWDISAQVGYRFRAERYANESVILPPVKNGARHDDEHRAGVAFRKDINQYFSLVAAWIGTFNISNKEAFQYNRQIGSIGIEARY